MLLWVLVLGFFGFVDVFLIYGFNLFWYDDIFVCKVVYIFLFYVKLYFMKYDMGVFI